MIPPRVLHSAFTADLATCPHHGLIPSPPYNLPSSISSFQASTPSLLQDSKQQNHQHFLSDDMSSDQTMTATTTSPQPAAYKAVRFLAAGTIGASLLFLSGITLTGTVIAVILATPVLVLFSPILVPAVVVAFLLTAGFFFSGGFGATALMTLAWMYKYFTGKHPMGADKLDYARGRIAETARDVTERAKDYGHYVQQKAHDATATATAGTTDRSTPTRAA